MDICISIFIYLTCFTSSIYFFKRAAIINERNAGKKKIYIFYVFLAIMIPCLLASLRDYSVGVDTQNYAFNIPSFAINNHDFKSIYISNGGGTEILFDLLIYLLTFFPINGHIILFILQLLTILPIYMAATKLKNKLMVPLLMGTYFFLFFNNSLNLSKQSISCSFILLGIAYAYSDLEDNNKNIKYYICLVISVLFHKAAIFGVLLTVICRLAGKSNKSVLIKFLVYSFAIIFPLFFTEFIRLLINSGILSARFLNYVDLFVTNGENSEFHINPFSYYFIIEIVLRLSLIVIPLLFLKKSRRNQFERFLEMTQILGFLIYVVVLFSMHINYGQRISMFLEYFSILFIPFCVENWRIKYNQRMILIYSVLVIYWLIWIVFLGWSGSGIYKFG